MRGFYHQGFWITYGFGFEKGLGFEKGRALPRPQPRPQQRLGSARLGSARLGSAYSEFKHERDSWVLVNFGGFLILCNDLVTVNLAYKSLKACCKLLKIYLSGFSADSKRMLADFEISKI